jgi:transposase InsO family protein
MNNAIARHKPNTSNLMFHSDQGTQYSSKTFIDYCNQNTIAQSMPFQTNQNHPFFQPSKSTKLLFIQYRKKP